MDRISQLEKLLQESPNDAFLIHALALEYQKIDNSEKAIALFEENLSINPTYIATYYHMGKSMEFKGDLEQARLLYTKGMELAKTQSDSKTLQELQAALNNIKEEE